MKKIVIIIVGMGLLGIGIWYMVYGEKIDPKGKTGITKNLDLQKYDFDTLRLRGGKASEIEILGKIEAVENRRAAAAKALASQGKYDFTTREIRFKSDGKWVGGMINLPAGRQVITPEKSSLSKVIIMIRGYAEKARYYPGSGTWRVADALAKEGYATISLDFLGYANSEAESTDVLEARFHKAVEVMDLIESVKQLPWVDKSKIGIWAHSNGGQIALSVLEMTGEKYPTVLWAPMTNPFPQSLIDTADEGEEKQKAIDFVNSFLKYYDGRRYAFENYYDWVKAPVLIQQGTSDAWCKVEWQEKVAKTINGELVIYDGADHNMSPKWQEAVERDVRFYNTLMLK